MTDPHDIAAPALLETRGLSFRYPRGRWLFRNLDLQVFGGEILAVLAPNARGKPRCSRPWPGSTSRSRGR